jgi:hypothetical protein
MKPASFAVGLALGACSLALSGRLAAETVSFPKDNPVFTIEVPADHKASFNEHGVLMIGADEFRLTDLKQASVASEEEAKKWIRMFVTAFADGRLAAAATPKVEVKKEEIAPGLSGYVSRGMFATQSSGGFYSFTAGVFQTPGGRSFYVDSFSASSGGSDLWPLTASIKLIKK